MRISDWSSDVCSSDLDLTALEVEIIEPDLPAETLVAGRCQAQFLREILVAIFIALHRRSRGARVRQIRRRVSAEELVELVCGGHRSERCPAPVVKIGRASCRERVCR